MTNIPADARFQVEKQGRKWLIIDTLAGERLPGAQKTRHLAEQEAGQLNADAADAAAQDEAVGPTPTPDPERVAAMVDRIEAARAAAHEDDGAEFQPEATGPVAPADMDRTQRILAAKAEVQAVRDWKAGEGGDAPATPVLDWMADPANGNKVHAAPKAARKTTDYTPEQLAAITAHIVNGRKAGRSWAKIAKEIEDSGIPTARGGKWYDTTASDLAKKLGLDATPAAGAVAS